MMRDFLKEVGNRSSKGLIKDRSKQTLFIFRCEENGGMVRFAKSQ